MSSQLINLNKAIIKKLGDFYKNENYTAFNNTIIESYNDKRVFNVFEIKTEIESTGHAIINLKENIDQCVSLFKHNTVLDPMLLTGKSSINHKNIEYMEKDDGDFLKLIKKMEQSIIYFNEMAEQLYAGNCYYIKYPVFSHRVDKAYLEEYYKDALAVSNRLIEKFNIELIE